MSSPAKRLYSGTAIRAYNLIFKLIAAIILLCASPALAFTTITPLGITIVADDSVKFQYNQHWSCIYNLRGYPKVQVGPRWKNIQWNRIDDFYRLLRLKYWVWPDPTLLTIRIMPIDFSCRDTHTPPFDYGFSGWGYTCINGIYPSTNEIVIHLGDDPGQGWSGPLYSWSTPFCQTALDWELFHYFLKYKGDPCWWDEFNPACQVKYQDAHELCQ